MSTRSRTSPIIALLLAFAAASATAAEFDQQAAVGKRIPFSDRSGVLDNPSDQPRVVYDQVIQPGPASWIRLNFDRLELGRGSSVRVTSLRDGATQVLNRRTAFQWRNSTAYFNGDAVRVELVAGPRSHGNVVEIGSVWVGTPNDTGASIDGRAEAIDPFDHPGRSGNFVDLGSGGGGGASTAPADVCGNDDRLPSIHPAVARLHLEAGDLKGTCTGSLFSESNCFVSAGHCVINPQIPDIEVTVAEFNVPLSDPISGDIVCSDPQDQYAVIPGSVEAQLDDPFCNSGDNQCPRDWLLFRVYPNSDPTGVDCRTPYAAQGARLPIADTVPHTGDVEVIGYGRVDDQPSLNHTQQSDLGPITSVSSTGSEVLYQVDTEVGTSGAPVVHQNQTIAIHRVGACPSNAGMRVNIPDFIFALDRVCPDQEPDATCCAIEGLSAACDVSPVGGAGGFVLRVAVDLVDSSHDGESIEITVDATTYILTVDGDLATARFPATFGQHTVSLVNPGECLGAEVVVCRFSPSGS